MSSYMYNPSRKISDLLSNYLEFDPEQLTLGVWSGHLQLTNVSLRHDAIYPLLNAHASAAAALGKPPLRFKLISSKIGNLTVTIPWKRLVWGQGDVQVVVQNVCIVLGLESVEEWEERTAAAAAVTENENDAKDASSESQILFPDMVFDDNDAPSSHASPSIPPSQSDFLREVKQSRLREAERRQSRGHPMGPWLRSVHKRDQQQQQNLSKLQQQNENGATAFADELKSNWWDAWLQSATKDFLWRFHSGLAMTIENVKIILIQDGVELGFMLPLTHVMAGKEAAPVGEVEVNAAQNSSNSNNDDGDHVDKCIKVTGLGVYVRQTTERTDGRSRQRVEGDPSTKEFVLRPVDASLTYSIFYPYSLDKRKAATVPLTKVVIDETVPTALTGASHEGSASLASSKRRGKRDKAPSVSQDDGNHVEEETVASIPETMMHNVESGSLRSRSSVHEIDGHEKASDAIIQSKPYSESRHRVGARPSLARSRTTQGDEFSCSTVEPLVQAENLKVAYDMSTRGLLVPHLTSTMVMGSVELVCSTRHYALLGTLLASSARIRNGRPSKTIAEVLHEKKRRKEHTTADDNDVDIMPKTTTAVSADVSTISITHHRRRVVNWWWRYAVRVIIRELRQRRRLRVQFQHMFLSFDWKKQRYKREEYIKLYTCVHLNKDDYEDIALQSKLLAIEDELCMEQILLYRAIARQLYARGRTELTGSLLDVCGIEGPGNHRTPRRKPPDGRRLLGNTKNISSNMAWIGRQAEIARTRHDVGVRELARFTSYSSPAHLEVNAPSIVEEATIAHTAESGGMVKTALELQGAENQGADELSALRLSFSLDVEKLELVIVKDDDPPQLRLVDYDYVVSSDVSLSTSDATTTDVSVLTDDQRFYKEGNSKQNPIVDGESIDDGPILPSTDFLLFKDPENALLRLSITCSRLSVSTSSPRSRNMNMNIGGIYALGVKDYCFLSVGSESDGDSMINNPVVSQRREMDATTLSILTTKSESVCQLDTSPILIVVHMETVDEIKRAFRSPIRLPTRLVKVSQAEEARQRVRALTSATQPRVINSSIRLHGLKVVIPFTEEYASLAKGGSSQEKSFISLSLSSSKSGVMLRSGLIEAYSGSFVSPLANDNDTDHDDIYTHGDVDNKSVVRSLRMLRIRDIKSLRPTFVAQNWVYTMTGVDIVVDCQSSQFNWTVSQSMFEHPVDFEALVVVNVDSVGDRNRARHECTIEASDIHVMLSKDRLEGLPHLHLFSVQNDSDVSDESCSPLLPRLEILSRLLLFRADLHLKRVRISMFKTKDLTEQFNGVSPEKQFQQILHGFLLFASSFDRTFPHEEALASAMQICIDKLNGIRLSLDDAWEVVNASLLKFLEIIPSGASIVDASTLRNRAYVLSNETIDENLVHKMVQDSVEETLASFRGLLDMVRDDYSTPPDIGLDVPAGICCAFVRAYYDTYVNVSLDSATVSESTGLNVIRIANRQIGDVRDGSDNDSIPHEQDNSTSSASTIGACLQMFLMDEDSPFGKGGLSLNALASDVNEAGAGERRRESLHDLEVCDVEFLCSTSVTRTLASVFWDVAGPFLNTPRDRTERADREVARSVVTSKSRVLCWSSSFSVLFASEDLTPFSRLTTEGCLVKNKPDANVKMLSIAIESILMENLTAGGELHPDAITVSTDTPSMPVQVEMQSDAKGLSLTVTTCDLQICFLQQYVSECSQFFLAEPDGLIPCLKLLVPRAPANNKERSRMRFRCEMHNTSLTIPRLSSSLDATAIEAKEIRIMTYLASSTFQMPTESTILQRYSAVEQDLKEPNTLNDSINHACAPVERVEIECRNVQLFTALGDLDEFYDSAQNAAFRYYYTVDGKAASNKPVYAIRDIAMLAEAANATLVSDERRSRVWKRITTEPVDLDILFDKAPHTRILLTEPFGMLSNRLSLDVALSQWCLLLSIWFSNMQELPMHFPYPISQLAGVALPSYLKMPFPEFGTKEFQSVVSQLTTFKSEVCVHMRYIGLRCSFDTGYFGVTEVCNESSSGALRLEFCNPVIHIANDWKGISRVGSGCTDVLFVDEGKTFDKVFNIPHGDGDNVISHADLTFGLNGDYNLLTKQLPQSFQMNICMTPKWTLYNLGVDSGRSNLNEFSSIFRLLSFVSSYFSDPIFGHPAFDATKRNCELKTQLQQSLIKSTEETEEWDLPGNNLDFRLWLVNPCLSMACDSTSLATPGVRTHADGIWYHYSSLRTFTVQELVARNLELYFDDRCIRFGLREPQFSSTAHKLVDNLSFGLSLNFNLLTNHSNYAFEMPFDEGHSCSLVSPMISVLPQRVAPARICKPFEQPRRYLGKSICDVTFVFEVMPLVSSTFLTLVGKTKRASAEAQDCEELDSGHVVDASQVLSSFLLYVKIADVRLFFLDPVLGPHLPVGVMSVSTFNVTASQLNTSDPELQKIDYTQDELNVIMESVLWGEYFKLGQTRSWEPLLEPYRCTCLIERSRKRGFGIALESDVPLHVNVSGALLVIIDEVVDSFRRLLTEQMGASSGQLGTQLVAETKQTVEESVGKVKVSQELPAGLRDDDRVAFSIRNMSGQKFRLRKPDSGRNGDQSKSLVISYLDHTKSTQLLFRPTMSVIRNMSVVEVDFPGLQNRGTAPQGQDNVARHAIDLQVPGFHWIHGIKVDAFGRSFINIVPRLPELVAKGVSDWRLSNIYKLLIEVGLQNGGRQVTVKSLFSVVNRTSHKVSMLLHPDPVFDPDTSFLASPDFGPKTSVTNEDAVVEPGESFQIPTLLIESALRQSGSHIGSLWLRPHDRALDDGKLLMPFLHESDLKNGTVKFTSRPVQLARIVSESASLFESNYGKDMSQLEAQTGLQVSCPVVVETNERLSPFCYAVEIVRSPLVKAPSKDDLKELIHGPVAYTLSIYPTFVVANLLPERGRFELMHAVHRSVVWFADLEPGQLVSVHSVGLDAPLLLFINLGFCKTPVGEGALVHHGLDQPRGAMKEGLAGLKSIGKAGKAVTKQLGKTLTKIGDSPDKRGHEKLFLVQNPQFATKNKEKDLNNRIDGKSDLGLDLGMVAMDHVGGKTYRTDTATFFPQDVVAETIVVDSLGQRLTLNIDNVRGGGGQRHISIFSPFWIVNTTEHSLRYRQDKSKSFVSGTVTGPDRDGSEPLSGGRAQVKHSDSLQSLPIFQRRESKTVFSGTPGALASSPGQCDLLPSEVAALVEVDLAVAKLAEIACMFNFNEGVLSIGHQKLCVQLWDGTGATNYASDWSQGFSLDSVGFSQVVSMHCRDGRMIELTMVVSVAPGMLSGYTKIVRFLPRYLVVNALPSAIRLWQDSSIFRPSAADTSVDVAMKERRWRLPRDRTKKNMKKVNQYEALWGRETILDERYDGPVASTTRAHPSALYVTTAGPSEIIPFILPDSRRERLLRVDLGGEYNLTASISTDSPGEHTLKVTKAVDLKAVPHVLTRASNEYEVRLPSTNLHLLATELGIWFETEWGSEKTLIVKAVKKDSFAFNETDVHIGDQLLSIDGVPVSRLTFVETMNKLRSRMTELAENSARIRPRATLRRASIRLVSSAVGLGRSANTSASEGEVVPLVLRFRTIEDRLRRLRMKASVTGQDASSTLSRDRMLSPTSGLSTSFDLEYIKAELRSLQHSLFLVIRKETVLPYRIDNCCVASTIYYRQKGCSGHPWQLLKPGQSQYYSWEEPLKPKRLTVRVGTQDALMVNIGRSTGSFRARENRRRQPLLQHVRDEEDAVFSAPVSVRLEEIGFRDLLTCAGTDGASARCFELVTNVTGNTRVLTIQDASAEGDEAELANHLQTLDGIQTEERSRNEHLKELVAALDSLPEDSPSDSIVEEAQKLMANFPEDPMVTRRHQLVVTIHEANGLDTDTFAGACNPYAEVSLKSNGRRDMFRKRPLHKTYYIKKTVCPSWNSQTFTFDVPAEAIETPRGHSLTIRLRNFRAFANHKVLGRAQVELHSLRDQKPLDGWFPLAGRTGRQELDNALSHWGRGSVRISAQWIYSSTSLLNYFILLSERRLLDLNRSLQGLKQQLDKKRQVQERKFDATDGFQRVRVHDLVSFSTQLKKSKRLTPPRLPRTEEKSNRMQQYEHPAPIRSYHSHWASSPVKNGHAHIKRRSKKEVGQFVSKQRSEHQEAKAFAPLEVHNEMLETMLARPEAAGFVTVRRFKLWSASNALFQDHDLEAFAKEDEVLVKLRAIRPIKRSELSPGFDDSAPFTARLRLPAIAPSFLTAQVIEQVSALKNAHQLFERATKRKSEAVLHPGGWVVIRLHTALNLPDSYTGMFVRVSFGPETLVSETVDAKVTPTWNRKAVAMDHESFQYGPNDMLIHIAPRKTSGFIRLSVFGEKSHPNLSSKTELGVLHLPLGSTISACIDCANENAASVHEFASSQAYSRWFPLMDPKDVVPVEGDWGLSYRPPESEKLNDSMFKEYFAPCIQLSILWFPDSVISNNEEHFENHLSQPSHDGSVSTISKAESRKIPSKANGELSVQQYFYADIGRISLALIDSQRAFELLSLSISDIDLRYWTTKAKTRYAISIGWLQIDQQDDNAREPVVLAPTPMSYVGPVIQALAVKDNVRSISEVISLDFIDVSVAEFDLTVEESILFDVFDFINSVRLRRGFLVKANQTIDDTLMQSIAGAESVFKMQRDSSPEAIISLLHCGGDESLPNATKLYIEQLFLGVVKVNLSYLKGKKQAWELTSQGGFVEKKTRRRRAYKNTEVLVNSSSLFHDSSDALMSWAQHTADDEQLDQKGKVTFPQLLASLIPNVSDAPIRLQGKALNHIFERPGEILLNIRKFYVNETLRQLYRLIGSLDFVGNPTMLFNSFFSGVRDLVLTPSQAFMRSPTDASGVGIGVAKGTLSLFSYCASGFFGFGAKVSAAAGQGIAWVTLDDEYRIWHRDKIVTEVTNLSREWKRRGVQSAKAMVVRVVADVLFGVAFGMTGIFVAPVKGYRRDGSVGLMKGMASGLIGIVTKPLVGVLDALTHFSASIHDIAKSVNVLDKRRQPALKLRLPYIFGLMYVLAPFERVAARANILLKRYPLKKSVLKQLNFDEVIVHVEVLSSVSGDTYLILTSCRVIVIRARKDASGSVVTSICWEVSLALGAVVSSRLSEHGHNGVALTVTVAKQQRDTTKAVTFEIVEEMGETDDAAKDAESLDGLSDLPADPDSLANRLGFDLDGEGQFHGTQTGDQGELLEWFTILAEYDSRAQLARLHNAISCMTGNFDAVVFDPSLGHPASSQGYTSFGMYQFSPVDAEHEAFGEDHADSAKILDNLPWMDENTFYVLKGKPQAEQKVMLQEQRLSVTLLSELESSKKEGGPEWLISARARAIYDHDTATDVTLLDNVDIDDNTSVAKPLSANHTGKSRFSKFKKWAASPLPSIADGFLETGADMLPFLRKRDRRRKLGPGLSDDISHELFRDGTLPANADTPDQESRSTEKLLTWNEEDIEAQDTSISFPGSQMPSTGAIADTNKQLDSSKMNMQGNDSILKSIRARAPFLGSESKKKVLKPEEFTDTTPGLTAHAPETTENRMDRMERLMERLLIFSSEQALKTSGPESEVVAEIRLELMKLRNEVQQQSAKAHVSEEDLEVLRKEIARLKLQLPRERAQASVSNAPSADALLESDEFNAAVGEVQPTTINNLNDNLHADPPRRSLHRPSQDSVDSASEIFKSAYLELPSDSLSDTSD
ncbi:hypothetical protein MPSEU_000224700 [Mayamaea pseudoterrestris]|nr:hypothetical protein MPSEU_000224700 [Mayamaea pseudoterrestris]